MARRPTSAVDQAEALFKAATSKPVEAPDKPKRLSIPVSREAVTLRIDNDVLAFFQEDGPGWQERINAALRKSANLD